MKKLSKEKRKDLAWRDYCKAIAPYRKVYEEAGKAFDKAKAPHLKAYKKEIERIDSEKDDKED
jgi:sulfatase maturation enzyme AslB (radical SAM superfamily)